jgi:hypothetical protein
MARSPEGSEEKVTGISPSADDTVVLPELESAATSAKEISKIQRRIGLNTST